MRVSKGPGNTLKNGMIKANRTTCQRIILIIMSMVPTDYAELCDTNCFIMNGNKHIFKMVIALALLITREEPEKLANFPFGLFGRLINVDDSGNIDINTNSFCLIKQHMFFLAFVIDL